MKEVDDPIVVHVTQGIAKLMFRVTLRILFIERV
jgi:hypothetical protein